MRHVRATSFALLMLVACASLALAEPQALLRIERKDPADRSRLIEQGVHLVLEREDALFALGEAAPLLQRLASLGRDAMVVEADTAGWTYFVFGLRPGAVVADLAGCGDPVLVEGDWALVRRYGDLTEPCLGSSQWFVKRLSLQPLAAPVPPPEPYASWQRGETPSLDAHPVVQTIVDSLTNTKIQVAWEDVVNAATTRYSRSTGCQTAAAMLHSKMTALGLNPAYQNHTSGHAPNVYGTLPGYTHPEKVVILIGHLDDLPSSGLAPGANDNASGAAMVLAAAESLAGYTFANTVKFVAVTGEEQGLYGSTYFANNIPAGEQVIAVLNADMIGWQGDGLPASGENLDVNTNSTSNWLGLLMQQAATAYGTGCVVDFFSCSSMVYSDHAPFWDRGWSAVCAITDNEGSCGHTGSYPYYHKSTDTIANCGTPSFFYGAVKAFVATAGHLAEPLCGGGAFPPVPTQVSATPSGDNRITVSWASGGTGVAYRVLRARGGCGGSFEIVATTSNTSWIDSNVSGSVTYAYRVQAVRAECVTDPSDCVTATTTGDCLEYPVFGGVGSTANAAQPVCTLSVTWSAATPMCSGPVIYNVYRNAASPFSPDASNRIATGLTGTQLSDSSNLTSHTAAHYIVRAVDASNGTEDMNTVIRTGVPTGPIAYTTWSDDAGDTGAAALTPTTPWRVETAGGRTGPRVYKTAATNSSCAALTTPSLFIAGGSQLTFWSKHFLGVDSSDKGQVEISSNGGQTWQRLPLPYPTKSTTSTDQCSFPKDIKYFAGINQTWTSYTASLAAWADQTIQVRFRLSTDATTSGEIWWIDDIQITQVQTPSACNTGTATLTAESVSVDLAPHPDSSSNQNSVLEPGETVIVVPTWHNPGTGAVAATGAASDAAGPPGASYTLVDTAADYGTVAPGESASCAANPYLVAVSAPAVRPAAHWDLTFKETLSSGAVRTWTVHVGSSFADVAPQHWAYRFVETVFHNHVTSGCNAEPFEYCPANTLSRAEMAVLLLMAKHGPSWTPPPPTGSVFDDVLAGHWAGAFIEELVAQGITSGCGFRLYCPSDPITRAQMAVFLLMAKHGPGYVPPPATGTVFSDVPAAHWAGSFIEQLAAEGITGGCAPGLFCPDGIVTRAEMAVFLTATFDLQLNH